MPTHADRHTYAVRDFLDDQQRLLGTHQGTHQRPRSGSSEFEDLDGPLHVVHTGRLRTALATDGIPAHFHDKYGDAADRAHCLRCHRVVRFLERWRIEIVRSGLALALDDPLTVREEFLDYLLNYETPAGETTIPGHALTRFLDQWGHRWM